MPEAPTPPDQVTLPTARGGRVLRYLLLILLLFAAVLGITFSDRMKASEQLRATTAESANPSVTVLRPAAAEARPLVLPARLQAWTEAPVFARNSGFLRARHADLGDSVRAGDLLAEIDAPELEQQLAASMAAQRTIEVQRNLAAATVRRWDQLASRNIVSQQTAEEKRSDLAVRESMLREANANVDRLRAQLAFNRVVAPFDGVVTSRGTDIGALIVAGDTRATPLFTISDKSRIRLYIRVPQAYAGAIVPGLQAEFTVPEYPNRSFSAEVQRSADAMDSQTGAMLVQLVAQNGDGALRPGGYAQLTLALPPESMADSVRIPASALLFRREGTSVAVVDDRGVVALRQVRIDQDLGATLDIGAGLSRSDWVIDSPSDAIRSGDQVRVVRPAT